MAQSSRYPIGVNLFWKTFDKLLRLKLARTELFFPTMPTLKDKFEKEKIDEARQREQRNEKRRVNWEMNIR